MVDVLRTQRFGFEHVLFFAPLFLEGSLPVQTTHQSTPEKCQGSSLWWPRNSPQAGHIHDLKMPMCQHQQGLCTIMFSFEIRYPMVLPNLIWLTMWMIILSKYTPCGVYPKNNKPPVGSFLVGGLEHFYFFHILGIIIPID